MADIELLPGAQLPPTARVRYKEIATDVYALVLATEAELVTNVTVEAPSSVLLTDDITGALVTVSILHRRVHEGITFQASFKNEDASPVADNGNVSILLVTGARFNHLVFRGTAGGDAEALFYEGVTVTDSGTALAAHNMKRYVTTTSLTNAFHTPTVTVAGATVLHDSLLPGGTGGNSPGGTVRANTEWLLSLNTIYLIRLINRAGNAQPMSLVAQWYEGSVA